MTAASRADFNGGLMSRAFTGFVLASLLVPTVGVAQTSWPIVEGDKIRVNYRCQLADGQVVDPCPNGKPLQTASGRLREIIGDSLHIVTGPGMVVVIPRTNITRMSVVTGQRGQFWEGALIGLAVGAGIGALAGLGSAGGYNSEEHGTLFPAGGVAVGAPVGFLVGGLLGARSQTDKWGDAGAQGLRVSVVPDSRGVLVGMYLAF